MKGLKAQNPSVANSAPPGASNVTYIATYCLQDTASGEGIEFDYGHDTDLRTKVGNQQPVQLPIKTQCGSTLKQHPGAFDPLMD